MTVHAVALVNSEGEITSMYIPGATFQEDGATCETDSSIVIRHITTEVSDNRGFMRTQYYKDGWKSRTWKGGYYKWKDEDWVFDADKFWADVRKTRTQKLYSCDWTQSPDTPLDDDKKAEWATYRQALRGITEGTNINAKSFDEMTWPTEPSSEPS